MNKIILLLLIIVMSSVAAAFADDKRIEFYEITDNKLIENKDYSAAHDIFPSFRRFGIHENFEINKDPSFVITKSNIIKVIINKTEPPLKNYIVTIFLHKQAADQIKQFTSEHIGTIVGIKLNKKTIEYALNIFEPLSKEIRLTMSEDGKYTALKICEIAGNKCIRKP